MSGQNMNHEPQAEDMFTPFGEAAMGTIEAGAHQQEWLDEVTQRLASGEFHTETTLSIPTLCVDGRSPQEMSGVVAPNAAGGTESLFVADDLTTKRYASDDSLTLSGYMKVVEVIKEAGHPIGGHTDEHAHDKVSGCGANDKLPRIYTYIATHGETLRTLAAQLGLEVSDELHARITHNAGERTEFSSGAELLGALQGKAAAGFVPKLVGSHNEVAAIVNLRPNTTLDRGALADEFGDTYQAFNVDAWTFADGARLISESDEEAHAKVIAMAYYNFATALVLSGPGMRLIVLE